MKTVSLREVDWDSPGGGFKQVDYPEAPIVEFIDWLRTTSQWRENPEQVFNKFRLLQLDLVDAKAKMIRVLQTERCAASTTAGERCKRDAGEDGLCGTHRKAVAA